jgi:hypothetical protein
MLSSCAFLIAAALAVGQAEEPTSHFEQLKALDYLTGTWTVSVTLSGQDQPVERLIVFEWALNKNVQVMTLTEQESVIAKHMIVWDAAAKQMKSFMAVSNGSYKHGTVVAKGDQLIFKNEGANASGKKTSGTMIYTKKDDDTIVFEAKGGWTVTAKRVKSTDAR